MAQLPIQNAGQISFQAADAAGDQFENDGNTQLWVLGPSAEFTVQFANGRACSFGSDVDDHPTYDLVAEAGFTQAVSERLSPFRFNDSGSNVSFTYSPSAVGIQVAAVRTVVAIKDPEQ